jgi:uncharacterized protein (DUF1778 family)
MHEATMTYKKSRLNYRVSPSFKAAMTQAAALREMSFTAYMTFLVHQDLKVLGVALPTQTEA